MLRHVLIAALALASAGAAARPVLAPAPAPAAACVANPFSPIDESNMLGGCKVCSPDGTVCEKCWDSYGLTSTGECVKCEATTEEDGFVCANCDGANPNFCLDCSLNIDGENAFLWYASEDGQCLQCNTTVDGCAACALVDGEPTCSKCQVYSGMVDGKCEACTDENCLTCNGDADICNDDGCIYRYFFNNETLACEKCGPGCVECVSADECLRCDTFEGVFGLDPSNATCILCSDPNCFSCPTAPDVCEECKNLADQVELDAATGTCVPAAG